MKCTVTFFAFEKTNKSTDTITKFIILQFIHTRVSGTFHHLCTQPTRWQTSPGWDFFFSSFFGEGWGWWQTVWGLSSGPEMPLFWHGSQRMVDWPPVQLMSTNEIRDGMIVSMCEGIIMPVAGAIRVWLAFYSSLHSLLCIAPWLTR